MLVAAILIAGCLVSLVAYLRWDARRRREDHEDFIATLDRITERGVLDSPVVRLLVGPDSLTPAERNDEDGSAKRGDTSTGRHELITEDDYPTERIPVIRDDEDTQPLPAVAPPLSEWDTMQIEPVRQQHDRRER